ncbi:aldose epimerase family protein [Bacteroides propionicifaciens]|uniref:aldose epimerase family protein n=1 Tax=Bacteroides propionicifaciens TaxID=392838 RepID=UPI00036EFE11|nr:aldose epimerase family protein [Bacteroides propionicifaciens]
MKISLYSILLCFLFSCTTSVKEELPLFKAEAFETNIAGKQVSLYTLHSGNGLTMQVTNYGGRIVSLWVPDKDGKYEDVVFGFESIDNYINHQGERYLGPVIGRYGNRIANAKFELDGVEYQLPANDNGNTLHGGPQGFDDQVWTVDKVSDNSIQMSYTSPDGEEGFPGTVKTVMTYELNMNNEFVINYKSTTDKPTHINLTNHSQFNLKGAGNGDILDHMLTINASHITPVDSVLIPTGEIASVEGTPFDFRMATLIGKRIDEDNVQLNKGKGYDHNWVVDKTEENKVELIATVYEPQSGRVMEVLTDQPGVQIYTGNFFTGEVMGKYNKPLHHRGAIALEVQKFPDTPNQPNFPTTRVNPGEVYTQTCIYKFSVAK